MVRKLCGLVLSLLIGCATAPRDIKLAQLGRGVLTFGVRGKDIIGPTAQVTRYPDAIRGRIGDGRVEVMTVREADGRHKVTGFFGGSPVEFWITEAADGVLIDGFSGGRSIALSLRHDALRGHAGCNELDLESKDGRSYRGWSSGSSKSSAPSEVVIPPALEEDWGPLDGATILALLLTIRC